MGSIFQFNGSYTADPGDATSPQTGVGSPINLKANLARKHTDEITLTADAPVSVEFGGIGAGGASVVILQVTGKKVTAKLTSGDGASQLVPVDGFLFLASTSTPITAIDLVRTSGADTTVSVFLGAAQ